MTVSALSATAIKHILENISGSLANNLEVTELAMKEASARAGRSAPSKAAAKQAQLTSAADRYRTNNIQDGILTENAAELLAVQFRDIVLKPKTLEEYTTVLVGKGSGNKAERKRIAEFTIEDLVRKLVGQQYNKYSALVDYYLEDLDRFDSLLGKEDYYSKVIDSLNTKTKVLTDKAYTLFSQSSALISEFNTYLNKTPSNTASTSGLPHREFNNIFYKYLKSKSTDSVDQALADFIDNNTDAGHLMGVYTVRIATLFSGSKNPGADVVLQDGIPVLTIAGIQAEINEENAQLNRELTQINQLFSQTGQLLLNADAITSNLINNLQVFVNVSRQNFQTAVSGSAGAGSVVEVQLSEFNQEAGRRLSETGKKLKAIVERAQLLSSDDPNKPTLDAEVGIVRQQLVDFFNSFKSLSSYIDEVGKELASDKFRDRVEQSVVEKILKNSSEVAEAIFSSEGSDTTYESAVKAIKAIFDGTTYVSRPTVTPTLKSKKLPAAVKKSVKSVNVKATPNKLKTKPVTFAKLVPARKTATSLEGLLGKINASIQEQIRKNMGTGNRRDVLNYRSGRFAQSVKVEKLSESRQGMITAFYSYMKNPYATFSEGGRQQYPRSRDPKSLISKSIREIAGSLISNRLRAVNV